MKKSKQNRISFRIGNYEIGFEKSKYLLAALNDFTVAIWFMAGSTLVLLNPDSKLKIYLYLMGSFQLLIRPAAKIYQSIDVFENDKNDK
ncbi:YrhK family protein [Bacillus massilinigeriensis]|uniref:YrhK family protein n=1 Tax=Bacillus mediterraneensis TaxID=1805474 RepID=UPI0008F960AF|nr:YrhK family protein [Bacillus mediterraneensis]